MTGGGIERVLRITSAALTGRSSIRRSMKTDRNERFSAQRKRSVFSECRPLQRSGGGRAARAALLRHHWGCEVSPLSGPCACLHHWLAETRRGTNRSTHRCSEQARLSASWRGTGAVTGGD